MISFAGLLSELLPCLMFGHESILHKSKAAYLAPRDGVNGHLLQITQLRTPGVNNIKTRTNFDKPETETWRPKQILSNHKQKNGHQNKFLQTGNRNMETRTYFDKPKTETSTFSFCPEVRYAGCMYYSGIHTKYYV